MKEVKVICSKCDNIMTYKNWFSWIWHTPFHWFGKRRAKCTRCGERSYMERLRSEYSLRGNKMIKDIKRIDLQGNEYLQESVICDRCKNVLKPKDYYYTIKLTGCRPVKMEPNTAYGLSPREPWHLCEKCYSKVSDELNGKVYSTPEWCLPLEERSTESLRKFRYSHVCCVETANEIDKILKERGY